MKRIEKLTNAEISAFFASLFFGIVVFIPWAGKMLQSADGAYADVLSPWYWDTSLGRWMICLNNIILRNGLTLPAYTVIVSSVLVGLTAVLWVKMFHIRSILCGGMTGALAILFPVVANQMTCFYFEFLDFESCLFATLAVYAVTRIRSFWGVLCGIVCLCLSLGSYQPGICVAATLSLFQLVLLSTRETEGRTIGKAFLRYALMGIGGCLLYVPVTSTIWKALNVMPATYGEIDTLGSVQWRYLVPRALETYKNGADFYFGEGAFDNRAWHFTAFYIVIFATVALLLVVVIANKKCNVSPLFWETGLICALLLPVGLAAIELIVPDRNVNYVMCVQYVLPLVACLKFAEYTAEAGSGRFLRRMLLCVVILLCNSYWMYDTAIGDAQALSRNKTMSMANRIVYRMESTDGYEPGMQILICGKEDTENYPRVYTELYDKIENSFVSPGYMWGSLMLEQRGWIEIIKSTCGIEYQTVDQPVADEIMMTEEYAAMPLFPAPESVQRIGDVMVVKLSENA